MFASHWMLRLSSCIKRLLFFICREYSFFLPLWNGIWGKLLLLSHTEIILSLIRDFWVFLRPLSHSRLGDAKAGNQTPQKSPPGFMLQPFVDKSSCFSFSCYPRQLPKPLYILVEELPLAKCRTFTIFINLLKSKSCHIKMWLLYGFVYISLCSSLKP